MCSITAFISIRATDGFEIAASQSFTNPTLVIKDNLDNTLGKDCENVRIKPFTPQTPVEARYIHFVITSYYVTAKSGGLQYLGIVGEKISGKKHCT